MFSVGSWDVSQQNLRTYKKGYQRPLYPVPPSDSRHMIGHSTRFTLLVPTLWGIVDPLYLGIPRCRIMLYYSPSLGVFISNWTGLDVGVVPMYNMGS